MILFLQQTLVTLFYLIFSFRSGCMLNMWDWNKFRLSLFKKIKEMCKNFPFCNALVSLAPVVRMDICSHLFLEYISHLNIFTRKKFVKFSKSANLTEEVDNWGRRKAASALPWHGMACPSDRTWHGRALWQGPHQLMPSKIYWSSHRKLSIPATVSGFCSKLQGFVDIYINKVFWLTYKYYLYFSEDRDTSDQGVGGCW